MPGGQWYLCRVFESFNSNMFAPRLFVKFCREDCVKDLTTHNGHNGLGRAESWQVFVAERATAMHNLFGIL